MGKQKARLIGFFNGKRRECELCDLHVHKNQSDVRWIRLSITMPLSGQPVDGMPDVFTEQFLVMEKENSAFNLAKHESEIDGATVSIFVTDVTKDAVVDSSGATISDFRLVGEGVREKRKVSLDFTVELPYSIPLRDWACDHLHSTFWIEVVSTQLEIPQAVKEEKKPKQPRQQALPVQ